MTSATDAGPRQRLVWRPDRPSPSPRTVAAMAALMAVVAGAWWLTLSRAAGPIPGLLDLVERTSRFVGDLAGVGAETPTAYTQASEWSGVTGLAVDTVVMSVVASGLAGLGALVSVTAASRAFTVGEFAPAGRRRGRATFLLARGAHLVARAVPELLWAVLIVFVLRPGVLAGALALALHEVGVLGRLGADVVDDVDRAPLRALRSSGAGTVQVLLFGVLPQVLPQLVTFLLYRWEVVIRATLVVGFITGAGLGHQLRLDLALRSWTDAGLILLVSVLLVWGVEAIASLLRRLAR